MKKKLLFAFMVIFYQFAYSQDGTNDPSFNTYNDVPQGIGSGFDSTVTRIIPLPDGRIILSGAFQNYQGTPVKKIVRLNSDATIDHSLVIGNGLEGTISDIITQTDGKIIVSGEFSNYMGTTIHKILRLNENGSLDNSFNPGSLFANGVVNKTCIQTDGKILVAGFFNYLGNDIRGMVRLNTDGTLDTSFEPVYGVGVNSTQIVNSIGIQSTGKIIIAGTFGGVNGTTMNRIARINADGTLDNTFTIGTGFNNGVSSIIVDNSNRIYAIGSFTSYNGTQRISIARLNANGAIDTGFNPVDSFDWFVNSFALQSDGKIVAGGWFSNYNNVARKGIVRIYSSGSIDTTFDPGGGFTNSTAATVSVVAIQPDGKILVGGQFRSYNGAPRSRIARLNTNATLDFSFYPVPGMNSMVRSVNLQPSGKIVATGDFTSFNSTAASRIAILNTDGSIDNTFNSGIGFDNTVYSSAVQADGKIVAVGLFTKYNGTSRTKIVRLNTDGTIDPNFLMGSGFSNNPQVVTIQPDGKIVAAGGFSSYNGTSRSGIVRINTNGSNDATFTPGTAFSGGTVYALAVQPDGKIIAGGEFTTFAGTAINRLVRINTNGTIDNTFNIGTGFDQRIIQIAVQPDGKIVLGGYFTTYNGSSANRLIRLNSDGSLDGSFSVGTGFDNAVLSLKIQEDGKILVGGAFTTLNGVSTGRLVRLNPNGSIDNSFNIGSGFDNNVMAIAQQNDGKLLIGGYFTTINGTYRNRIARLLNCAPATSVDVVTACGSYTWIDGNQYTTDNNTATYLIPNGSVNGCDSIVTLNLTFGTPTHNSETASACDSYSWNGTTYTTSGIKLYDYTNSGGCPSTDTLHLTITNGTFLSTSHTTCDESYEWNGTVYTTSGTQTYSYTNAAGCPSTDTLHLTIMEDVPSITINHGILTIPAANATYQWLDCDNNNAPIAGATGQSFTPTANGNYAVIISINECSDTSACFALTNLGIAENNMNQWTVSPNPSTGTFVLHSNAVLEQTQIEVYSAMGQLVYTTTLSGNTTSVDLTEQATGVYTIHIRNSHPIRVVKH